MAHTLDTEYEDMPFSTGRPPVIGVPVMDDHDAAGVHAPRFSNNQSYIRAVEAAGAAPILIPHVEDPSALRRIYELLDGILLSGGVDIHPKYYGQEPHPALNPSDVGMDRTETTILGWALEDDMPVLGICRGEQVLNVVMGGTLIQDIYTQYATTIDHRESFKRKIRDYLAHDMVIEENSRLRELAGQDRIWVNTSHHQSIDKVAPGLVATAWAPDGIIEAVESTGHRYVVAVQCHPEELWRKHAWARRLFASFVDAATEREQPARRTATLHPVTPLRAGA
jgi:putative glutamine amidotransferase